MFSCPKSKVNRDENSLNDSGTSGHPLNASFTVSTVLEDGNTEGLVQKFKKLFFTDFKAQARKQFS